jgi:hypothetical protein
MAEPKFKVGYHVEFQSGEYIESTGRVLEVQPAGNGFWKYKVMIDPSEYNGFEEEEDDNEHWTTVDEPVLLRVPRKTNREKQC